MRITAPDVPPWFYTSTADEVYYYFRAILSSSLDLKPFYSEYLELLRTESSTQELEGRLLRDLRVDRDLLITYRLDKPRAWYETASPEALGGYAGAVNPTYITLSRRAHRDRFVFEVPARDHGHHSENGVIPLSIVLGHLLLALNYHRCASFPSCSQASSTNHLPNEV